MGATAVDAVLVPRQRVHERLHHQPEGVRRLQFHFLQEVAERLVLAAATRQILHGVMHLVVQEALQLREVEKIADAVSAPAVADEITDRRAVRIAARQRREILEAQLDRKSVV